MERGIREREKVLGVAVDPLRLDRAMSLTKNYLNSSVLNKIYFASTQGSILAQDHEEIAAFIDSLDLVLPGDKNIEDAISGSLKTGGELPYILHYLYQLFARFDRNKNSLYIVSDDGQKIEVLIEMLEEAYPNMKVQGREKEEDWALLVNEINVIVPDAILFFLPISEWKEFMEEHGKNINSSLAICGEDIDILINGSLPKIPAIIEKLHLQRVYANLFQKNSISATIQDSVFKKRLREQAPKQEVERETGNIK